MEEKIRKIAIMQPYIFPYIGYFQLINAVDKFIIYDDVDFIKRGFINRNKILINDKPNLFTLPVKNKSIDRVIDKHEYALTDKWKRKFKTKISRSYNSAPNSEQIKELIYSIIEYENKNVSKFNYNAIKKICKYLNIETIIHKSSRSYNNSSLKGEERIIDICKKESADIYINPIGGKKLYNSNNFEVNDITLRFIKPHEIHYNQFSNSNFVPNLSIIDVLMFNNKQEVLNLLNRYELVK